MNLIAMLAVVFSAACALQPGNAGGLDDGKADGWGGGDLGELSVIIDETGDGEVFDVNVGQSVVVRLPSNPSTGYEWQVISTDRTFGGPASRRFIADDSGRMGAGGLTELVWETDDSPLDIVGIHHVVLGYIQNLGMGAGSMDIDSMETFSFTVDVHEAPTCLPVMCALFCEHGFEVDEHGCEIYVCAEPAECEPVLCELYCAYGFDVDERGCEVCACAEAPECEPVLCELYCAYGFDVDERGCEVCACAEPPTCPPVMCELYCENGFAIDEDGCEICACAD